MSISTRGSKWPFTQRRRSQRRAEAELLDFCLFIWFCLVDEDGLCFGWGWKSPLGKVADDTGFNSDGRGQCLNTFKLNRAGND
ncbi:hypothetical protein AVEN_55692-1 [Araneus ventricosus]|uniref:Uncharacterized protein n=1 Tax=Araneus ventricosus TaxID=182803 RepID=A0A4Y2IZJ2_ARAVE|nr:hypothetical protein AVEN_55692-1 [Araneus ventricosus]